MSAVFRVGDLSPWKYFLGVSIVLGILFAALRPEGTAHHGRIPELLQWLAQAMIPMALCIVAHLALHRSAAFDHLNPWMKLLFSGFLGAFLFSPVAYGIDLLLGDWPDLGNSHLAEWLDELGAVLVPVAFTWVAINAPFRLGYAFRREVVAPLAVPPDPPADPQPSPSAEPFFLGLIPAERRGEVIHMKSELHYLSVATIKGQSLILYALRDAILDLPPDMGIQTHRSYWANLVHVKEFKPDGRLATLRMSDGATIPVSRSKVKDLKARLGRLR